MVTTTKELKHSSRRGKSRTRLGLIYQYSDLSVPEGGLVMGAEVAMGGLAEALIKYTSGKSMEVLVSPSYADATRERLGELTRRYGTQFGSVAARSYDSIVRKNWIPDFTAAINLGGARIDRELLLRSTQARRPYPIIFISLTFSYQSLLHADILRKLLLCEPFDAQVCTSKANHDTLVRYYEHVAEAFNKAHRTRLSFRGRFEIIPHGVDTDIFRPRDRAEHRSKFNIPADAFVILWFGRFSLADKMDLTPLILMFKELRDEMKGKKLLLLLAGSAERDGYAEVLRKFVDSRGLSHSVEVRKNISPQQRHLLYNCADIFVSPVDNVQETCGITPIEAMASGIPQVVADWDGYRDTVDHERTGFRVPTYWMRCESDVSQLSPIIPDWHLHFILAQSVIVDMSSYKNYLRILIENDDLRGRMAEESRRRAVKEFSWEVIAKKVESLWTALENVCRTKRLKCRRASYEILPYFAIFQGYPTEILSPRVELSLTGRGKELLAGDSKLPMPPRPYAYYIDPDLFAQILGQFPGSMKKSSDRREFSSITKSVQKTSASNADYIRRHVLWLLKYGYLEMHRNTRR